LAFVNISLTAIPLSAKSLMIVFAVIMVIGNFFYRPAKK
jgi:hypothetical protein